MFLDQSYLLPSWLANYYKSNDIVNDYKSQNNTPNYIIKALHIPGIPVNYFLQVAIEVMLTYQ